MREITIAVDGPAASGKSTTARAVAEQLGYCHLNSGLLYRAITWAGIEAGWIDDTARFEREVEELDLRLDRDPPTYRVRIADAEVVNAVYAPDVAARVSEVAAQPCVRAKVLYLLRREGREGGLVCDGRDIGTVVYPEAELKVFLRASAVERARRRLLEWGAEPTPEIVREEAARLTARDARDSGRDLAPLRKAADAVELDTTFLEPSEVAERIVVLANQVRTQFG